VKRVSKKESDHRQAVRAALKKEQERAKRLRLTLAIGIPVVVVAVVAILVIASISAPRKSTPVAHGTQIIPAVPTGATTVQSAVHPVSDDSGIAGVLAWDTSGYPGTAAADSGTLEHQHVTGPVRYAITPPAGGPHNSIWMNAGVYTRPIPSERAVHNLEHGAVWITYNANLPSAQIAALTAFVAKQSLIPESADSVGVANDANRYVDLSPWATSTLPTPIVISAWGHQLRVTSPTDPRLQRFVDTFRHNAKYSPEFGAGVDGIPVETGGRADSDGGTQANPAGAAQ
jgi:hypothetical protein